MKLFRRPTAEICEDPKEQAYTRRFHPDTMRLILWDTANEVLNVQGYNPPGESRGYICKRTGEYLSGLFGALNRLEDERERTISFCDVENEVKSRDPEAMAYAPRELVDFSELGHGMFMRRTVQTAFQTVMERGPVRPTER